MDVIGLVLGLVVLIKPTCTTINESLSNYRGFGQDAERLRLRFAVQQAKLESLERVLFANGKFAPAMPGRLVDHLPRRICDDLLGLLRQLYEVLLKYASMRKEYSREVEVEAAGGDGGGGGGGGGDGDGDGSDSNNPVTNMSAGDRMAGLLREGKKADAAHQKAVGWARKMMWVAMDRSGTERLVGDFERWTGQMQALLEACWWPLSFFETLERMRTLERDGDARDVGLLRGIGVRKVLAAPLAMVPAEALPPMHLAPSFHATASQPGGNLELGQLQLRGPSSSSSYCLVEYKSAGVGAELGGDEAIRQRIVKLAALLHVATESDPALRLLPRCVGYFHDAINMRFGLAYSLPPSSPTPSPSPLATLATLLDAGIKRSSATRPSLCARMRLARELCLCLQRLHAYSWLHKSLRSENLLFLSSPAAATAAAAISLEAPQLVGFEYARQELDGSDQIANRDEMRRNIYRHPARWGSSPVRFEKVHDIYALGVILLELGLWSRADQVDNGAFLKPDMAYKPAAVRDRLLRHAQVRLAFHAGDRFRDVVVGCLAGTWQDRPVEDGFPDMVVSLEAIANGLEAGVKDISCV